MSLVIGFSQLNLPIGTVASQSLLSEKKKDNNVANKKVYNRSLPILLICFTSHPVPILIYIIGALYILGKYTGKTPYYLLQFGKFLYHHILKTSVNFSMKFFSTHFKYDFL